MSEFEYYHHDAQASANHHHHYVHNNHHHDQQRVGAIPSSNYHQSYNGRNDYSSSEASSSTLLDDGYVLFQSVQISIPILPFLIMTGFVCFVMGVRAIKYFQLSVNWHVITKSFKHQIILLSLFFQIPLLCFYLYSLIKVTKSDASLILMIVLNSIIGGVASFAYEKSLGYFVIMLGCFTSSLLVQEAHIKTILICLCFLVVVLKIQKIIFQRNKAINNESTEDNVEEYRLLRDSNSYDDNIGTVDRRYNRPPPPTSRVHTAHHLNNNGFYNNNNRFLNNDYHNEQQRQLYNHQRTAADNGRFNAVPPPYRGGDKREDIFMEQDKRSNWSWIGSTLSNLKWFSKKQQDGGGDILERRNVKLQVPPERTKALFDRATPANNHSHYANNHFSTSSSSQRGGEEEEETNHNRASPNSGTSYASIYPSLTSSSSNSSNDMHSRPLVEPESTRNGISPYLLNQYSSPLPPPSQSNSTTTTTRVVKQQPTVEIVKTTTTQQEIPSAFTSSRQQQSDINGMQKKQRQPQSSLLMNKHDDEEECIPTASTFDQDDEDDE